MSSKSSSANHNLIFVLLVVLSLISVATTFLSISPNLSNWYVFGIAAIMATMVLLQYMDLKSEGFLVFSFFIVPVLLFAILVLLVGLASPTGPKFF